MTRDLGKDGKPENHSVADSDQSQIWSPSSAKRAYGSKQALGIEASNGISRRREPIPERVDAAIVEGPGLPAPLLMPVPDGRDEQLLYRWALRALDSGAWPDQRRDLARLARLECRAQPIASASSPTVGLVLSEPAQLTRSLGRTVHDFLDELEPRGARVVLVPPGFDLLVAEAKVARAKVMRALMTPLDGHIGLGGRDVHPRFYGQTNRHAESPNYPQDRLEAELFLEALEQAVCGLGVCRSHQLWNAALGGTLVQDMVDAGYVQHSLRTSDPAEMNRPLVVRDASGEVIFENRLGILSGSDLGRLAKADRIVTNSNRHQGVATTGRGMRKVAWLDHLSPDGSTAEATEWRLGRSVQWHPERVNDALSGAIFDNFVRRSEVRRLAKAAMTRNGLSELGESARSEVETAMRSHTRYTFEPEDHAWLRRDLAPWLSRAFHEEVGP